MKNSDFDGKDDIEVVLVASADFRALVLSGQFERLAVLGLLVPAVWKLGTKLARPS